MPCRLCRENARAAGATFDCLAVGAIHAHRFSPVIYNETLCRYTSRNFPSFSRENGERDRVRFQDRRDLGRLAITAYRKNNKPARGPGVTASKSLS